MQIIQALIMVVGWFRSNMNDKPVYRSREIKPSSEPVGRLPEMGQNATYNTPSGAVQGQVVQAQLGGPYVIRTPQGLIQVSKVW